VPDAPLRLSASVSLKERRLASLLAGHDAEVEGLQGRVRDAQVRGSLELAGLPAPASEVEAAQRGDAAPEPAARLHRALRLADPRAPLTVSMLQAWHRELEGSVSFRATDRSRPDGPPPAPVAFVESRLAGLEEWLAVDTGRELKPAQQGALALARILEVVPFERANGRIARLAASHLMVRAGARPPILVGADASRLEEAVSWAFRLETGPLVMLLDEASERALDLQIEFLEQCGSGSPSS
jgi:Fic/DOC family